MLYIPKPYQRIGAKFIVDVPRAMVIAEPGLGKTSMVLSALDMLYLAGSNFFPVLVLAPKRVAQIVWPAEQQKWDRFKDLKLTTILGAEPDRLDALQQPIADVYVINYDNVQWLVNKFAGKPWPFKTVIADESTRLKNFRLKGGGERTRALSTIAQKTGRWINLTGTPAPNGLEDLWGQFWFLDFGERLCRTHTNFMQRWFVENQYTRQTTPAKGAEIEIYEAVKDITICFRTEDWLDVQKPEVIIREVELPPAAMAIYRQMEEDFFVELPSGEVEAFNAASKSMKLLQIASGSMYDHAKDDHPIHDAKNDALESIVEENEGENILVAYYFNFDAPRIKRAFPKARVLLKQQDYDDWNAGKIPVALVHMQSAGHGLNLQDGGRILVYYSQIWDLEYKAQVLERIGPARQMQSGHPRLVKVYNLAAKGTLDIEAINRVESKLTVQQALLHARRVRGGSING